MPLALSDPGTVAEAVELSVAQLKTIERQGNAAKRFWVGAIMQEGGRGGILCE
jgi:hypothetical protein